jgi:hypothetical protein
MTNQELMQGIEEIPGSDGWWKESSKNSFENKALTLVEKGFTHEEALCFLEELYWDVANCYGG